MPVFFVDNKVIEDDIAYILDRDDIDHVVKVLRKKEGSSIKLCDGIYDYSGRIIEIENHKIKIRIESKSLNLREPKVNLYLFQCIIKSQKMDFIVQKATELGVKYIVPVISRRVVIDVSEKEQKKISRWQRIANEAQKQCLRPSSPIILKPISIYDIFSFQNQLDCLIVPYEKEEQNLLSGINNQFNRIGILIGPEGGFDVDEIEKIKCFKNLEFISLGKRILRAETASISAISIVMHLLGEM